MPQSKFCSTVSGLVSSTEIKRVICSNQYIVNGATITSSHIHRLRLGSHIYYTEEVSNHISVSLEHI